MKEAKSKSFVLLRSLKILEVVDEHQQLITLFFLDRKCAAMSMLVIDKDKISNISKQKKWTLQLNLESVELPFNSRGSVDIGELASDHLIIYKIEKFESAFLDYDAIPPKMCKSTTRILKLRGNIYSASSFDLELSDKQYKACKRFAPNTAFKFKYRLEEIS